MLTDEQREQIVSIIDDVQDMTIATVREDGYPQATTVSYVNDGLTIYFGTAGNAQKAENISRNNKVSVTIDRDYKTWNDIESLSLGGFAAKVSAHAEQQKIGELFLKKFPEAQEVLQEEMGEPAFFRIEPQVISILDYSKGFGHTELVTP